MGLVAPKAHTTQNKSCWTALRCCASKINDALGRGATTGKDRNWITAWRARDAGNRDTKTQRTGKPWNTTFCLNENYVSEFEFRHLLKWVVDQFCMEPFPSHNCNIKSSGVWNKLALKTDMWMVNKVWSAATLRNATLLYVRLGNIVMHCAVHCPFLNCKLF